MTDRRDRVTSVSGEDIRRRYNLDDMVIRNDIDGFMERDEAIDEFISKDEVISVANGGTGKSELTEGSFLIGAGSDAVDEMTLSELESSLNIPMPNDYIVARGSSSRGSYVKYNSGRLEMWGSVSGSAYFSSANYVFYHSIGTVTFPIASLTIPYIVVSVDMPALAAASVNGRTTTSFSGIIMSGNSGTSSQYSYRYDYHAIGTWK